MSPFLLLLILLFAFIVLLLAFFALSSCLGDEIRAAWSGGRSQTSRTFVPTTFGLQYARMSQHHSGQAGWEQIEMQDMMDDGEEERYRR